MGSSIMTANQAVSHSMLREIFEEPEALRRFLENESPKVNEIANAIRSRRISNVVIAARGTSDNAGQLAKYLFEYVNRKPVSLAAPSIYTLYGGALDLADSLVLGISQSGEGPDVNEVVRKAREAGALTVGVTNNADSQLARTVEYSILCHAGVERSVAATKTYVTELAALYALSFAWASRDDLQNQLRSAIEDSGRVLETASVIRPLVERYRYMTQCVVLGRGFNYSTVLESSLKLKETCYIVSEPYSSADFMHGPIALIEQGFPAFLIAPPGKTMPGMVELTDKLLERGAEVVVISSSEALLKKATTPVKMPVEVPEVLSPLLYIIPMQLFSYYLAVTKGFNPDQPRGLKKVTMTT
ncbi:MAG TPA: SIS domain-containing protein [Firmicutes bacterium]|nr:SIS domain-containing protein [Bacillota bacterium]